MTLNLSNEQSKKSSPNPNFGFKCIRHLGIPEKASKKITEGLPVKPILAPGPPGFNVDADDLNLQKSTTENT